MYFPEYSISNKILKNISNVEYARAVVENTPILENWQTQLEKKALTENIHALLQLENYTFPQELVKKRVDGLADKSHVEIENVVKAYDYCSNAFFRTELDVEEIKELHAIVSQKINADGGYFRNTNLPTETPFEQILAKTYDLTDWLYSQDAQETHQVIRALLFLHEFLRIKPFKKFNFAVGFLVFEVLLSSKTQFSKYLKLTAYFQQALINTTLKVQAENEDLTEWLETGIDFIASESFKLKDEILLLAKDTKVAKASGFVKLSQRQKRIVEYLQDYGILRNKDFSTVFPDVSEDSVLRDLKVLIAEDIVIKTGSTKSSCYVLK